MADLASFFLGDAETLALSRTTGLVLFVLSLPLAIWTAWNDMRAMKIPNKCVLILASVFVLAGPLLMPLEQYGWQLLQLAIVLLVGILMNAFALIGAGDAKFAAAAAPYIAFGDLRFLVLLFSLTLLAAVATHRLAKISPLRKLAPDWESWERKKDFPMGLALGGTLSLYLGLAAIYGA